MPPSNTTAACPECGGQELERLLSGFAVKTPELSRARVERAAPRRSRAPITKTRRSPKPKKSGTTGTDTGQHWCEAGTGRRCEADGTAVRGGRDGGARPTPSSVLWPNLDALRIAIHRKPAHRISGAPTDASFSGSHRPASDGSHRQRQSFAPTAQGSFAPRAKEPCTTSSNLGPFRNGPLFSRFQTAWLSLAIVRGCDPRNDRFACKIFSRTHHKLLDIIAT